ncbi:hypothetical protein [Roseomonas acroporae]|nr:hypothetical protein [Roseomonas acroporae]
MTTPDADALTALVTWHEQRFGGACIKPTTLGRRVRAVLAGEGG